MLTLLREWCTWFALDSMGSCPPKEMGGGGGALLKTVNKFVSTLGSKKRRLRKMYNDKRTPLFSSSPPSHLTPQGQNATLVSVGRVSYIVYHMHILNTLETPVSLLHQTRPPFSFRRFKLIPLIHISCFNLTFKLTFNNLSRNKII